MATREALKFLMVCCFCCNAFAKDLGVFGETFEIQEKNLMAEIIAKLQQLERRGDMQRQNEIIKKRIAYSVMHPKRLAHLTKATARKEYKFDPTITLKKNLQDHKGRVFAKAGEQFNPLSRIRYSKRMIFIDGEDESQIQWALNTAQENTLIILTAGSPVDFEKKFGRIAYFDQFSLRTTQLGIQHVPAVVFQKQDELVLTIVEEVIE